MATQPQAPLAKATVPLPSADLITYRFDQTDKSIAELKADIGKFTSNFLTLAQASTLKEEHNKDIAIINKKFDDQRWYWRAVVTAVLTALAASIIALVIPR